MTKSFANLLGGAIANKQNEEEAIRRKIVIRETLREFIPLPSQEEYEQLEKNILAEGIREPIVLWHTEESYIIIDGHNRYSICQKHGITFPFKVIPFKDEEEAKDWMIRNQLGRRNLSPEQQSYLRGLRYLNEKSQGSRVDLTSGQNGPKLNLNPTASRLASEYNVSERTIKRDAQFAKGLDKLAEENPTLKKEVLSGKSSFKKKEIEELGRTKQSEKNNKTNAISKPKVSVDQLASIALEFIKVSFLEHSIPFEHLENVKSNPLEFFVRWHENRNANLENTIFK
jgi:hypothetical protein